ncbi:MAG: hypothetical protein ACD_58C00200G0009 [uncultured bacterium]|nr:MAG: hypothetical protein ACD_58C00200G0009 [uncultured bacterium]
MEGRQFKSEAEYLEYEQQTNLKKIDPKLVRHFWLVELNYPKKGIKRIFSKGFKSKSDADVFFREQSFNEKSTFSELTTSGVGEILTSEEIAQQSPHLIDEMNEIGEVGPVK